jgi:IS4 transposase
LKFHQHFDLSAGPAGEGVTCGWDSAFAGSASQGAPLGFFRLRLVSAAARRVAAARARRVVVIGGVGAVATGGVGATADVGEGTSALDQTLAGSRIIAQVKKQGTISSNLTYTKEEHQYVMMSNKRK